MKKAGFYCKSAAKFALDNFPYLFAFAVVPAIFHALMRKDGTYFEFFLHLKRSGAEHLTFYDIYSNFSMILSNRSWWAVLALVGYWLGISGMAYQVEKIMRIGKRSYSGFFGGMNNNMLSALVVGVIYLVSYELVCLVGSALLIGLSALSRTGFAYVVAVILILAMYVGLLFLATPFFVWLPCLFVNGYRFGEGFVETCYLLEGKTGSVALAVGAGFLVQQVIFLLCKVLFHSVFFPLKVIVYTLLMVYYVSLAYTVFFDLTGQERADLKKKYGEE